MYACRQGQVCTSLGFFLVLQPRMLLALWLGVIQASRSACVGRWKHMCMCGSVKHSHATHPCAGVSGSHGTTCICITWLLGGRKKGVVRKGREVLQLWTTATRSAGAVVELSCRQRPLAAVSCSRSFLQCRAGGGLEGVMVVRQAGLPHPLAVQRPQVCRAAYVPAALQPAAFEVCATHNKRIPAPTTLAAGSAAPMGGPSNSAMAGTDLVPTVYGWRNAVCVEPMAAADVPGTPDRCFGNKQGLYTSWFAPAGTATQSPDPCTSAIRCPCCWLWLVSELRGAVMPG